MENQMKSMYLSDKLVHVTGLSYLEKGGKTTKFYFKLKSLSPTTIQMAP